MFEIERIYGQHSNKTGLTEWFFTAREGIFGPFASKADAAKALDEFKKFNIQNDINGGRSLNGSSGSKLSLVPLESYMYQTRWQRHSG